LFFWDREAKKKELLAQMKALQASRIAGAKEESYSMVYSRIENEYKKLLFGEKDFYRSSWKELKK
jgi:hypothetical protein